MIFEKNYINGKWCSGAGQPIISTNPSTLEKIYQGNSATQEQVNEAVRSARTALQAWANLSYLQRCSYIERYTELLGVHQEALAKCDFTRNWKATLGS